VFCRQIKPEKCRASRQVGPNPLAEGSGGQDYRSCREQRDRQVRHDDRQVCGDGRVDGQKKESPQRNLSVEDALQRECEGQQQQTV